MNRYPALILLLAVVFTPLSAIAQSYPKPYLIYANTEYQVGYMGCIVTIKHGQYDQYFAYANMARVTGRDKCEIIIPRITATLGSRNGQYGSAVAPGTELRGSFTMHAISYGLKCRMEIFVNANGTWSVATQYVGGYGICPSTPAWILRT